MAAQLDQYRQQIIPQNVQAAACFPHGSAGEESACSAGDLASIPGSGRSPGGGKGYPLQYSCLENSMDRGAWQGLKESDTTEQLTLSL